MGRHKIPMEKIVDKNARQICFSKRRMGLFRKAGDLCSLGHEIVIVVFSPAGNAYCFAHPSVESVARRLNKGKFPDQESSNLEQEMKHEDSEDMESSTGSREEHWSLVENTGAEAESYTRATKGYITREELLRSKRFWWNKSMDGLGLEELVELERATAELKQKVVDRANFLLEREPLSLGSLYSDK